MTTPSKRVFSFAFKLEVCSVSSMGERKVALAREFDWSAPKQSEHEQRSTAAGATTGLRSKRVGRPP